VGLVIGAPRSRMRAEMGGEALIQYRFDSVEQLARHLHQFGDASLLFVRDEQDQLRAGRILVELQLRLPRATTAVRAQVIARSAAPLAGAWIQMDARLARHLQRRGNLTARRERRVGTNQMLQLSGPTELVVELVDISRGGVRIRGAGALLNVSDRYTLRLLGCKRTDGDLGTARVVHVHDAESGLRFTDPGNPRLESFLQKVETAWTAARHIEHARNCCIYGPPVEPATPRVRSLN
jgi:PilZ domain